ncbi:lipase maturation factor family protein [Streptomyces diastaticus]
MTPAPEKTRWTRWRTTPGLLLPPPLRRPLRLLRLDGLRPAGGTVPSPDAPPFHVRVRLYRYRFTTREERRAAGDWWHRTLVREQVGPTLLERGPRRAGRCPALRESRPGKSGNGPLGAGHRGGRTARARPADLRGTACGACCVLSTRARTSLALDALGRFGRAPRVGAGRRGPTKIRRTAPRGASEAPRGVREPCAVSRGGRLAGSAPATAVRPGGGRTPATGPPRGPLVREGWCPASARRRRRTPPRGQEAGASERPAPAGGAGPVRPGRQSTLGRMCGSARSSS